ncbi:MAG: hypothetical protein CMF62_11445 [Magnetococcales bacterium]|nr:hypothetical protein [Magnetococcales bacterium]
MKNILLATAAFAGAAVIGGVGYKAIVGCPQFADATCVSLTEKGYEDGDFKADVALISATPEEIKLKVTSNFKCPVAVRILLEGKTAIEGFPDKTRPTYLTPVLTLLENGEGTTTISAAEYPELAFLPAGEYKATVTYSAVRTGPVKEAYYKDKFDLGSEGVNFKNTSSVVLPETFATAEQYASYMQQWKKAYTIAKEEGLNKKTLPRIEKLIGGYETQSQGLIVQYTFPETNHVLRANAKTGAFTSGARYANGWEGL